MVHKKVYYIKITAEVCIRGNEQRITVYPNGTIQPGRFTGADAFDETAGDQHAIEWIAAELSRLGCLTGEYEDDGDELYASLSHSSLSYLQQERYEALFSSLRKFVLTEGKEGREFLTEDVDIDVCYLKLD